MFLALNWFVYRKVNINFSTHTLHSFLPHHLGKLSQVGG